MPDSIDFTPAQPYRWSGTDGPWVGEVRKSAPGLDGLLAWAFREGASRISFQTGHPVTIRVHGRNCHATDRALDELQLALITNHLYGADGTARLQGGKDFDTSYEIICGRSERLRFRVNATPTQTRRAGGANLVLRPIPNLPPSLEQQLVEPEILAAMRPREGLIIVGGATGSGKSTLIAGMTMAKLQDPDGHYNILEGAAPIEFLLEHVPSPCSTLNQTEIPRDLESFAAFIRGCMRREPSDIIVGECRDAETMGASVQAAISGHVLTTTIHANDVALTMQRIASLCPPQERANLISAIAQSLRLVVNQRLTRSADGRRTALREFLVFDPALRLRLLETDPAQWPSLTRQAVEAQGQPYRRAIEVALAQGRITAATAARELQEVA